MSGKIISIQSGKGGVGKTTLAVNLASSLASDYRKKVLLVDANISTPHIGMHLGGVDLGRVTIDDLVLGRAEPDPFSVQRFDEFHVLPSRGFDEPDLFDPEDFKAAIYSMKPHFDYIILDSSPGIGNETMASLISSDEILFVSSPQVPDMVDILRISDIVDGLRKRKIGVVLNKVARFSRHLKPGDVEMVSDLPVVGIVPYDHAIHKSIVLGRPVVSVYPGARASQAIRRIAGFLVGEKPKMSIWDRLVNLI